MWKIPVVKTKLSSKCKGAIFEDSHDEEEPKPIQHKVKLLDDATIAKEGDGTILTSVIGAECPPPIGSDCRSAIRDPERGGLFVPQGASGRAVLEGRSGVLERMRAMQMQRDTEREIIRDRRERIASEALKPEGVDGDVFVTADYQKALYERRVMIDAIEAREKADADANIQEGQTAEFISELINRKR